MKYVIGIDLGTSSVKALLVNQEGEIISQSQQNYPLIHNQVGFSEQDPEQWVQKTILALKELVAGRGIEISDIEGISFSGQMHSLVTVDKNMNILRPAILWNDTRTTKQRKLIEDTLGTKLLEITKNRALEGFTLPKLLWMKENEPDIFDKIRYFMLPKDYLRFRLTGIVVTEYSDAAGTLLLDVENKVWSKFICDTFQINMSICPPLVESNALVGELLPEIAIETGLSSHTKVFAGGADNACGAIGAGLSNENEALCSIGTSGVFLVNESKIIDYQNNIHFFNHALPSYFYSMGVTLSAGYSLSWLKKIIAPSENYEEFLAQVEEVPIGSDGLLFTPYLLGERTPHADSNIRGCFIGIDATHRKQHFIRAVMEGIVYSLNETATTYEKKGKNIHTVISIGGGSKNKAWLQMQADIFNKKIKVVRNEQGPSLGAAIIAAVGLGWFDTFSECIKSFVTFENEITPNEKNVQLYKKWFEIYKEIYPSTSELSYKILNNKKYI